MYKALICMLAFSQIYNAESTIDILARARRPRESRLQSCDVKKNDMCDKSSKQLWAESKKGECAKKECNYTPKMGVTQHPHSPYFRYQPSSIKSSTKKILHSFKDIKGEICAIQNQPCSCRNEAKCTCESDSAKFCKQQYRVERSYFIVLNNKATAPTESVYGQTQSQPSTQQYFPSTFDQSQYFQPSARSGEIKSGSERRSFNPRGFGAPPMRSGSPPDSTGMQHMMAMMQFGQTNPQYHTSQFHSMPGSMYNPGLINDHQSELLRFQTLVSNLNQKQPQNHFGQGAYPPYTPQLDNTQHASSFFPEMMTNHHQSHPPAQQDSHQTYQPDVQTEYNQPAAPSAQTHHFSDPMTSQTSSFYPAPPAPQMPDQSEQPAAATHQHPSTANTPSQYAEPQAYSQQPQYYSPGSQMYASSQGSGMQNSAMLRYLLFQSKGSSSNSFLQILPYLMGNKQFSNLIRLESLYVMVPDGCKCQRGAPNTPKPTTPTHSPFNLWSKYQQPFGQFSSFPSFQQGGHQNPFSSFGPYSQSHLPGFGGLPYNYNPFNQPPSSPGKKKRPNKRDPQKNKDSKKPKEKPKKTT